MSVSSNQKLKPLYLMKILLEKSDEQNLISINEIIKELSEYGISAERKSLYTDIEHLREYGIDIVMKKEKTFGYFVGKRQFKLAELKLLVDTVQSSKFITTKKSDELIQKLSSLTSINEAKQLKRQVVMANRPKSHNEEIYYNVDKLHLAINESKKVLFKYFDYTLDKQKAYRKNGADYEQNPIALCWNEDNYYLIAYNKADETLKNYRVDRMTDIRISDEDRDESDYNKLNIAEYSKKTFKMYNGELVKATMEFDMSLINVVIDRFGADVMLRKKTETTFEVTADVAVSPTFFGWMFQFGKQATILKPEKLVEAIQEMVYEQYKKYEC